MRFLFVLLVVSCVTGARGQEIQNGWSYRNIPSQRYIRLNYENDAFFGTDYYFTQGVHFEAVHPAIEQLPTRYVLLHPAKATTRFGLGLESAGYTPTIIYADSILQDDRPFAGMAYLKAFSLAVNESRKERYSSTLTIGLMGPSAGGYEIQSAIHRQTKNPDPAGWKNQVGDALILNYELTYERAMFMRKGFLLSATGMARAGTYSIKAAVGGTLMAGWFVHPYQQAPSGRKEQLYLYVHPQFDFVGYDATLQGGLFMNNSPYTISDRNIDRFVFRFDAGLRLSYHRVLMSIYARYVSREFGIGLTHAVGGLELGFAL